jgi:mRNA-degrading endonuclease RelE of RelBE toxin-antitoxin system
VASLADDPRPPWSEDLRGVPPRRKFRAGKYRVLYVIDDRARVVLVTVIDNRDNVYRKR